MSIKQDSYIFWLYLWETMDDEKTWVYSSDNGAVQMGPLDNGNFFTSLAYHFFY